MDKRYAGDNRLISPKSSHQRGGLAPRCRLASSWIRRNIQGFVCSPIKEARELGLDRRETGWVLSAVRELKRWGVELLVREDRSLWAYGVPIVLPRACWVAKLIVDNHWKHLSKKPCPTLSFLRMEEEHLLDRLRV